MSDEPQKISDAQARAITNFILSRQANDAFHTVFIRVDDVDTYFVFENRIYRMCDPNEISPEHSDPATPAGLRQVFSVGFSSKIVSRSLLTANSLMNSERFDEAIPRKPIFDLVLSVMDDLLAAEKIQDDFLSAEAHILGTKRPLSDREIQGPSENGLLGIVQQYFTHIEHAVQVAFQLTQLFYGHKYQLFEGFAEKITIEYGSDDEFAEFAGSLASTMAFIVNASQCIKEPGARQKIVIKTFSLDAVNSLARPTIEVVHSQTPQTEIPLGIFLQAVLDDFVTHFEVLLAHVSDKHIVQQKKYKFTVAKVREGRRDDGTYVRYGYLTDSGKGLEDIG